MAEYLAPAGEKALPGALLRTLYAETGGNPFYVCEVFRHLLEEGRDKGKRRSPAQVPLDGVRR